MYDPERLYRASDPDLRQIAAYATMAAWRCRGEGPSYVKIGKRVFYHGRDLNEWIERGFVRIDLPVPPPPPPPDSDRLALARREVRRRQEARRDSRRGWPSC